MKILITGAEGYLGSKILTALRGHYEVFSPKKSELDLKESKKVEDYMNANFFDWIIHLAIAGGREKDNDSADNTLFTNLKIFYNLMNHRDRFNNMINFTSGAEFDRRNEINSKTNNLYESFPIDFYGMSKNIISRIIKKYPYYNLRLYSVFGVDDDGFINMCLQNCKSEKQILINNDRFFDFFFIDDVIKIIKDIIANNLVETNYEFDLVYKKKLKLSQIANYINELSNNKVQIIVENNNGQSYTGNYYELFDTIKLIGLKEGINNIFHS